VERTQTLKGVLPVLVLAVLAEGETYGYDVHRQLRRRGIDGVGDASVYGTLQRLYEDGYVSSYLAESTAGPSRRYYALSSAGRNHLKLSIESWREFSEAVTQLLDSAERS
jgi:PadR family transcriptional regulator PadR